LHQFTWSRAGANPAVANRHQPHWRPPMVAPLTGTPAMTTWSHLCPRWNRGALCHLIAATMCRRMIGMMVISSRHTTSSIFPKFDGSCDPLPWLNRCKHYFCVRGTPDHKRVLYASFYLLDNAQLWYHRLELNNGVHPWMDFTRVINAHFGPPMTDTPLGALALLCRTGSVDNFYDKFMALSY
jgi:hypothetical protein